MMWHGIGIVCLIASGQFIPGHGDVNVITVTTPNMGLVNPRSREIWNYTTPIGSLGYNTKPNDTIRFMVRTSNDAFFHIGSNDTTYEIVIGAAFGSKIYIRENGQIFFDDSVTNIVSSDVFTPFWIKWDSVNCSFGKGFTVGSNVLGNWTFNRNFRVHKIGIMSGFGSTGDWTFYLGKLDYFGSKSQTFTFCEKQGNQSEKTNLTSTEIPQLTSVKNPNQIPTEGTIQSKAIETGTTTLMTTDESPFVTLIIKDLFVDKTKLSSYRRRKTSADDDRISAKFIGYVGVAVISSIMSVIVAVDITKIFMRTKPSINRVKLSKRPHGKVMEL